MGAVKTSETEGLAEQVRASPGIRAGKVARMRRLIARGVLETPRRLEATLRAVLRDLRS